MAEWLDTASKHVEAISRYLMVNLHFEEAQLDGFWSFVQKNYGGKISLTSRVSSSTR